MSLDIRDGLACACLYGVTILLIDILQRDRAFSLDWWWAGMSHAGLIREGEWWRAVTALGLHADSVHLAGNLVFGLVFGFLAGELLGWGLAWFGMLLAGVLLLRLGLAASAAKASENRRKGVDCPLTTQNLPSQKLPRDSKL